MECWNSVSARGSTCRAAREEFSRAHPDFGRLQLTTGDLAHARLLCRHVFLEQRQPDRGDFGTVVRLPGRRVQPLALCGAGGGRHLRDPVVDERRKLEKARPLPEITYITSWPEERTDAETQAFIKENQRRKDQREALLKEQEKIGQDMYMALGRATGVDVDAMKAKADADRAAAEAAAKAKAEALLAATRKAPVER